MLESWAKFHWLSLTYVPECLSDSKSALLQVMAWYHQATLQAITWTNVDADPRHHMTSLVHKELIA